ncbi:retrograde regulation protein 2 [Xylogone sp. PMI_703]|nr:retrograde regulation protein 2 [Xylogone sp. PMI_703]
MSADDLEKDTNTEHAERVLTAGSKDAVINTFSEKERRQITRHVDYRLVTTLGVLYCASLMDRTNLGSAAIAGMTVDLKLVGSRYNIITLIFFIPYVLFQPPATVLLRKVGPRVFLSSIVVFWGACMIGFGFAPNWEVMVGLRIILGVLEAGFFPGCAYLLSCWYPRYQLQKRNAVFYLIGSMASALSGILAYGLMQMKGQAGLNGWRWIFIMEGVLTCVAGIIGYFLIVDFPENSKKSWKFLDERQASYVVAVIERDRADAIPEPFRLGAYLKNALDLKVWAFAALFMLTTTNSYAIAYFLPIILRSGMGFDLAKSQCLVAPPYVAAAIVMFAQAYYADKLHIRGPVVVLNAIIGLIGLPLLGFVTNNGVRYFGVFLATICANANVPAVLTYQANNIRGQWKRAFCSATLVGAGGIGGIIGSTVFRDQDAPRYVPGIEACMIANGLCIVIVLLLSFKFQRANKRAERGGKVIEKQAGFRYTL